MLNPNLEKNNDERLIMRKEVFAGVASTTPFENTDDVVLSGSIASIVKGKIELRPRQGATVLQNEGGFTFKEKQIQDAQKESGKFPDNPWVLNNLGLTYLNCSEIDKAIETFKTALRIKSNIAIIALNLASAYLAKNQDSLALNIYKDLEKLTPDDPRVLINIANIHLKNKKLVEAKEIYNQIIKDNPKNIGARNKLALIYLIEGNYNSTISELRKCLSLNMNSPAIYNNMGIAYGAKGLFDKAKEAFSIALKLSPNYTHAIFNLAETLKTSNNISEAIEILERYLEVNDNNAAKELLAGYYLESGKPQKSLRIVSNLLTIAEKSKAKEEKIARLLNNIAVIYHKMGDFANAENSYLTSIKRGGYPNDIILGNIIDLYFVLHKFDEAKKFIDILHDKFGVSSLYYYYLSLYAFSTFHISESVNKMREFIKINKQFSPAYSFLSFLYSEHMYNYKKAVELNKEAIQYLPRDISIINNLAYNYLMNNEISEGKKLLEEIKHITNNLFITATTGLLRIREGDVEDGKRLYDIAASMAGNEFTRKQVIQKKHIELAKYYLLNQNEKDAKLNINSALIINIENSIYTKQAEELLKKLQ